MDDVSVIQKEAAKKQVKPVNRTERPKPKKKNMVVKNTNTAMGQALAAALGNTELEEDRPVKTNDSRRMTKTVNVFASKIKNKKQLADELGIGELTLEDILQELEKPARDPREDMPAPILRSDVLEMKDLKPGMVLKGTVRNVIDFGAFVDIGVHQDGLVHISEITNRFIKHPLEAVKIGDIVDVKVMSVDVHKKRIALTMKDVK
jgi:uncharacterized protein